MEVNKVLSASLDFPGPCRRSSAPVLLLLGGEHGLVTDPDSRALSKIVFTFFVITIFVQYLCQR